jgi:hypothetical protein
MKVKEYIKQLQKLNPEEELVIDSYITLADVKNEAKEAKVELSDKDASAILELLDRQSMQYDSDEVIAYIRNYFFSLDEEEKEEYRKSEHSVAAKENITSGA